MKIAIMQPYFVPYIGYFQLINAVDQFVIYDNIKYTKKGWINRNRILVDGKDEYITLPIRKDSDYLHVDQRKLADSFVDDKNKILRKLAYAYRKAPHYDAVYALMERILEKPENNLFEFIYKSVLEICRFLEINTTFVISSTLPVDHELKSQDRVIAICKALNTTTYINPPGGVELYSKETFNENNIELEFLQSEPIQYHQFKNEFIASLSIIDVMMFNSTEEIKKLLASFYTIK
ncbi:WbqC family protein [Lacibacter sediminis]|uniref:WbqC family protein n=1 Tax=Lacibacter sediminis TaxID=2760713 RepID=A0A7G5XHM8_9BACT|nr:WbqC family protein [Lacibacter sediminis]QNA44981.1 WbqC family protein [Lacibacter sediminis]